MVQAERLFVGDNTFKKSKNEKKPRHNSKQPVASGGIMEIFPDGGSEDAVIAAL